MLNAVPASAFTFAPLDEGDLPLLRAWLLRPHVATWWGPTPSLDALRDDYLRHADAPNATRAYLAWLEGKLVGFIQRYVVQGSGGGWWEDETDPGARGIDQFLADGDRLGQGRGRAMIRAFLHQTFADPAVTAVQTDPRPDNVRAQRCYVRCGFVPVRELVTPDGPALLMRCTRESLRRACRTDPDPSHFQEPEP